MRRRRKEDRGHGIFWGVVLVGLGVVFLLSQQGILPRHLLWSWWMYWPGVMVAYGLMRLVRPRDASDIGGGVIMSLIGLWLFTNYFHWWGLEWNTSWPIAFMIIGAGIMARALASGVMRDRSDPADFDPREKENSGVQ